MSGAFGMEREHSKHKSVEWYSPGWVFDGLELTFDVDPCSPFDMETVRTACLTHQRAPRARANQVR